MPLTVIDDFRKLLEGNQLFGKLADVCDRNNGLWSGEAEKTLLNYYNVAL